MARSRVTPPASCHSAKPYSATGSTCSKATRSWAMRRLSKASIAWCASNPHVSSVITGASRVEQVEQNMRALDVVPLLTPEILKRIDAAVA